MTKPRAICSAITCKFCKNKAMQKDYGFCSRPDLITLVSMGRARFKRDMQALSCLGFSKKGDGEHKKSEGKKEKTNHENNM
jgi:hypothetical protein